MHHSSMAIMKAFVERYLNQADILNIYDVGSMSKGGFGTYKTLFDKDKWVYIGLDVAEGPNVDHVLKSEYEWDIDSECADVVISGQCLEHVEYFWLTAMEMARILKPEGLLCLIVPSAGREHRYPVDCWRFLPDGLNALARYAGLKVLKCETPANADNKWKDCLLIAKKQKE